jgi:Leucine-rich repeat (LRR) protein
LVNLTLASCNLSSLQDGTFSALKSLKRLDLLENVLQGITNETFSGVPALEYLDLGSNEIEAIDRNAFYNLAKLKFLFLNSNFLSTIDPFTFATLVNLVSLDLNSNALLESGKLGENIFTGLTSLVSLSLSRSSLTTVNRTLISGDLKNLKILFLYNEENFNMKIREIEANAFKNLISLKTLSLFGNEFASLPQSAFDGLNNLTSLFLGKRDLLTLQDNSLVGLQSLSNVSFVVLTSETTSLNSSQQAQLAKFRLFYTNVTFSVIQLQEFFALFGIIRAIL